MIDDVDKTIKKLLELEFGKPLPFDLSYLVPDKSFSPVSSSMMTLNCYLYRIIEDRDLRTNQSRYQREGDRKIQEIPPPARVEVTYCVTAWSPAPATSESHAVLDEHRLLSDVLRVLLKYPVLPRSVLVGTLKKEEYPVPTTTILPNSARSPWDFWNALGGQLRPSLEYNITFAMDYNQALLKPMVLSRTIKSQQIKNQKHLKTT